MDGSGESVREPSVAKCHGGISVGSSARSHKYFFLFPFSCQCFTTEAQCADCQYVDKCKPLLQQQHLKQRQEHEENMLRQRYLRFYSTFSAHLFVMVDI